jgi:hypothetical protein
MIRASAGKRLRACQNLGVKKTSKCQPYFDGDAYANFRSNVLADLVMSFYENDICLSLPDQRPITLGIDEAAHQHVVTYRKLCHDP